MSLRLPRTRRAAALIVVATAAVFTSPAAAAPRSVPAPSSTEPAGLFLWPVDAPLVDLFRRPAHPYGPGNRGIDFDTAAGQPVVATAPGEVVFAGAVGHAHHVVVRHPGSVRTSYSFLQRVEVRRGQSVEAGDVVGRAGATLHFGVRVGAAYVDPLSFLGLRPPLRPYLVQDRDERRPARRRT